MYFFGVVCALQPPGADDPLPQFEGDGGDVVGAGDGRAVEGNQVRRLNDGPALRLQVDHYQLLLHQHHQRTGIFCRRNKYKAVTYIYRLVLLYFALENWLHGVCVSKEDKT